MFNCRIRGIFGVLYKLECLTAESEETKDLLIFYTKAKILLFDAPPSFLLLCVRVCVVIFVFCLYECLIISHEPLLDYIGFVKPWDCS